MSDKSDEDKIQKAVSKSDDGKSADGDGSDARKAVGDSGDGPDQGGGSVTEATGARSISARSTRAGGTDDPTQSGSGSGDTAPDGDTRAVSAAPGAEVVAAEVVANATEADDARARIADEDDSDDEYANDDPAEEYQAEDDQDYPGERRSGGAVGYAVAAVFGGIISLGGFLGLSHVMPNIMPSAPVDANVSPSELSALSSDFSGKIEDVTAQLAEIDSRTQVLQGRAGDALTSDDLEAFRSQIETQIDTLTAGTAGSTEDAVAARIAEIETQLTSSEQSLKSQFDSQLQAARQSGQQAVEALETRFSELLAGAPDSKKLVRDIEEVSTQLDQARETLKERFATLETSPALTALRSEVDGLKAEFTEGVALLRSELDGLKGDVAGDVDGLRADVDTWLERLRKALPAEVASSDETSALAEQLAALETRYAAMQQQLTAADNRAAADRSLQEALGVAMSALNDAVDKGRPFASELDVVATHGVDEAAFTRLSANATNGVANLGQLKGDLTKLADQVASVEYAAANPGLQGQLLAQVQRFVAVRKVGDSDGSDSEARLARAESALQAGALDKAVNEVEELKGASAELLQDWLTRAKQRQQALEDVALVEAKLLAGISSVERAE